MASQTGTLEAQQVGLHGQAGTLSVISLDSVGRRIRPLEAAERCGHDVRGKVLTMGAKLGMTLRYVPPRESLKTLLERSKNTGVNGAPIFECTEWLERRRWADQGQEDKVLANPFYETPIPAGWALISPVLTPTAQDEPFDYLAQTVAIRRFLREQVFADKDIKMPDQIVDALEEFDCEEIGLRNRQDSLYSIRRQHEAEVRELNERLVNLKLNQLCRETPGEVVAHDLMWEDTHTRPLMSKFILTNTLDGGGSIVRVGFYKPEPKRGGSIGGVWAFYTDKVTSCRVRLPCYLLSL